MVLMFIIFPTARICMCDRRLWMLNDFDACVRIFSVQFCLFELIRPNESGTMGLEIYPIKNICE